MLSERMRSGRRLLSHLGRLPILAAGPATNSLGANLPEFRPFLAVTLLAIFAPLSPRSSGAVRRPAGSVILLAYRWRCCGMVGGATKEPGMCRHRLSQEETEGGCACVPRVVRDARDEKDARDAHLVRLVSLNQLSLELCGGSSPLNGTSLCEVADVGRFLFLGFDSDCFGCYALGFWLRARVVFSRRSLRRSLTAMPPP